MTRYSVDRFREAVLRMYLRIAVAISFPLALFYSLFIITPDRGLAMFAFALCALGIKWHIRHDEEGALKYAGWFVLALMLLMLYGVYISGRQIDHGAWVMIFPVAYAPIVSGRERGVWAVAGASAFATAAMLRPDPPTAITVVIFVAAYLTLTFIVLMLVYHNEQNIERLARLTVTDPLTKVYNRGHLKDVLMSEINRCRRNGLPLTVVMLDIDFFKAFNDNYGHLFGDSVLEQVALSLKRTAQRAGDAVFRYGGEEFCIVAPGLERADAHQFAEKLRTNIRALDVENRHSPHRQLTISVGFWCVRALDDVTPSELLLNADNALYRAKADGRNRVVDFDDIVVAAESGQALQAAGHVPRAT